MATTTSDLRTETASAAPGGTSDGGRRGVKAKLVAGVVVLGCAAGLALGGLRAGHTAPPRVSSAPPAVQVPAVDQHERQRFLEQNRWLPDGTLPVTALPHAQQRFLELNTVLPARPERPTAPTDPRTGPR
jgi:hypothetical protein